MVQDFEGLKHPPTESAHCRTPSVAARRGWTICCLLGPPAALPRVVSSANKSTSVVTSHQTIWCEEGHYCRE